MRTPRRQCESEIYHVICRGVGKQLIFEDDKDRERFLTLLTESSRMNSVEIIAWCLMGNHVHLLFHAPIKQISHCMQRLCGSYAQFFNLRHVRSGHLFQERFKSKPVEDESALLATIRYIHSNPEKAGITTQDKYPWSSYTEYATKSNSRMICSTSLILGLLDDTSGLVDLHETHSDTMIYMNERMDVETLRSSTRAMPDETVLAIAHRVLGGRSPCELKTLDKKVRNPLISRLLTEGLPIRQIERLTGIGRGIIQKVRKTSS